MKPNVKEFRHEKPLKEEISRLSEQGETKKDLYVMARDENLAKAIANQTNANQMDLKEDSLGSRAVNLFRNESKVIRHRFKELGFSQSEA
ncbi:MAG TPA: general stress protein [Bacillales bacterium]|nr:general stress protein [Bacillales bacterium]